MMPYRIARLALEKRLPKMEQDVDYKVDPSIRCSVHGVSCVKDMSVHVDPEVVLSEL